MSAPALSGGATGDTIHWRMPVAWQRLTAVAVVALCAVRCAPGPDVSTARRADSNEAAAESTRTLPALRRAAPMSLADRAAWRVALGWAASCDEAFESSRAGEDGGLVIHGVAPRVSLVEVLCAAGAYQPSHVYIRYDEQGASPIATSLQFPVFLSGDGATLQMSLETEIWGEASLSSDARVLSVLMLSRQLADCGIWSRYAIGGERSRLIAAAARLPCPATPGPPAESANGGAPPGWRPLTLPK